MTDTAFDHAVERARARFNWNLTRGEWLNMNWLIRQGQAFRLRPGPDRPKSHRARYLLEFRGRKLAVGFDEFSGKVLTLMKPGAGITGRYTLQEVSGTTLAPPRPAPPTIDPAKVSEIGQKFKALKGHAPFEHAPAEPTGRPSIWDPPTKEPPPYTPPAGPVRDPSGPQEAPDLGPMPDEPLPITAEMVEAETAQLDSERQAREHRAAAAEPASDAKPDQEVKPMGKERDVTPRPEGAAEEESRAGVDDQALVALRANAELAGTPAVVIDLDVEKFKARMDAHLALREHALSKLKEGRHYGTVPGVPKPFLWLPGSDLLAIVFGLAPGDPVLEFEETFEDTIEEAIEGQPGKTQIRTFRSYRALVRVPIVLRNDPSRVVFAGRVRQASMSEKLFRDQTKRHYNTKRGVWVEAQPFSVVQGKVREQSEKRSLVQGVREVTGVGDRFTQDEELHSEAGGDQTIKPQGPGAEAPRLKSQPAPARAPQPAAPPAGSAVDSGPASQATLNELMGICKTHQVMFSKALKDQGVTGTPTEAQARAAIAKVRG